MSSLQIGNVTQQVPTSVDLYSVAAGTVLNITAATVIKAAPGRIVRVNVNTAGSTAGSVSDVATVGGVAAGNLVASIPNAVGPLWLDFPCFVGIVVTPGTAQVLSVSFY